MGKEVRVYESLRSKGKESRYGEHLQYFYFPIYACSLLKEQDGKVGEYYHEITQSQTTDQPTAPGRRATEHL